MVKVLCNDVYWCLNELIYVSYFEIMVMLIVLMECIE